MKPEIEISIADARRALRELKKESALLIKKFRDLPRKPAQPRENFERRKLASD